MLDASSFVASTPVNEFAKLTINLRTRQTGQTGVRRYINGTCIEWHAERKVSPINSLERDLTKIRIYVYNLIAVIYRIRMLRISICVFNGSRKIEKNSMKGNTSLTRMMPLGDPLLRPRCDPVFRIGGGFSAQPIVVAGSVWRESKQSLFWSEAWDGNWKGTYHRLAVNVIRDLLERWDINDSIATIIATIIRAILRAFAQDSYTRRTTLISRRASSLHPSPCGSSSSTESRVTCLCIFIFMLCDRPATIKSFCIIRYRKLRQLQSRQHHG